MCVATLCKIQRKAHIFLAHVEASEAPTPWVGAPSNPPFFHGVTGYHLLLRLEIEKRTPIRLAPPQ